MNACLKLCSTTLLATWIAAGVSAQSLDSTEATLGLTRLDGDGGLADGATARLDLYRDLRIVSLDFDLDYSKVGQGGDTVAFLSAEVMPTYWFSRDVGVGAYLARARLMPDDADETDYTSLGLEGRYRAPGMEASAFFGRTYLDDAPDDADLDSFGLRARYDVTDRFSVFGSGVYSTNSDDDASKVGLGAMYGLADTLSIYGGYQVFSDDGFEGDFETASVGVNYTVGTARMPIVMSGEYTRISGDGFGGNSDADRLGISATFLFGDRPGLRPRGNGVTANILRGDRDALTGLLTGVGY